MSATMTEKLVKCLRELENLKYSDPSQVCLSIGISEKTLNLIFEIGRQRITFNEEEKRIIGPLMVKALKPIQINIESTASCYRTRLEGSVLQKRSALQFLVDNYASFPVNGKTLKSELQKVDIQESIGILQDIIDKWYDVFDSDEGDCDFDNAGASDLSDTHSWWFKVGSSTPLKYSSKPTKYQSDFVLAIIYILLLINNWFSKNSNSSRKFTIDIKWILLILFPSIFVPIIYFAANLDELQTASFLHL